jgi:hypothetical protein
MYHTNMLMFCMASPEYPQATEPSGTGIVGPETLGVHITYIVAENEDFTSRSSENNGFDGLSSVDVGALLLPGGVKAFPYGYVPVPPS